MEQEKRIYELMKENTELRQYFGTVDQKFIQLTNELQMQKQDIQNIISSELSQIQK